MKTQTTFDDLVLEFPALDQKQGRALKGGYVISNVWFPPYDGTTNFYYSGGGWIGGVMNNTTGGSSDCSAGAWDTSASYYDCYSLDYSRLPSGNGSDTQIQSFCVYKTMEVANHYFYGSLNSGTFALAQTNVHGFSALQGFSGNFDNLKSLANQFFNINSLGNNVEGVKDALANGHPVMATLMVDASNGHEVLITQCNTNNSDSQNNQFRYFDPETGVYYWKDASNFQMMVEITGNK